MCKLHPSHQFLSLKNAMNLCYKANNFINAAYFARKILSLDVTKNKQDLITQHQKYYAAFKKKGTNEHELSFNPEECSSTIETANDFICCGSLKPLSEANSNASKYKDPQRCPF